MCAFLGYVARARYRYLDSTRQLHLQLRDLLFELIGAGVERVHHERHPLLDLGLFRVVDLGSYGGIVLCGVVWGFGWWCVWFGVKLCVV